MIPSGVVPTVLILLVSDDVITASHVATADPNVDCSVSY